MTESATKKSAATKKAKTLVRLFETVSLGAPEHAVGFVLWRVVHRYQRDIDRALAPVDLTHLQFTALAMTGWMARSGAAVTQIELARFSEIHPMQISHLLKALEAKGLVCRARSSVDTRSKSIEITDAGIAALRDAMPIAIAVQQRMFGNGDRPGPALLDMLLDVERTQGGDAPKP